MYKVLRNLKHNGVSYTKGDKVEIDDEEAAEHLLKNGVIEEDKDLSTMTKDELLKKAEEEDIDVSSNDLKADIKKKVRKSVSK